MTLTQFLDRLKELDETATPRPWFYDSYSRIFCSNEERSKGADLTENGTYPAGEFLYEVARVEVLAGDTATPEGALNAQLIEELRNALPAIRKVVRIQANALEYYANSSTYQWTNDVEAPDITEDRGEMAREAIADCDQVIQEGMK